MSTEDIGLLAALSEAHRANVSKTFIVRFSPDDTRQTSTSIMGMPFGSSSIGKAWVVKVTPGLQKKIRVFKSMLDMLPPNGGEDINSKINPGGRDSVLDNLAELGTDPLVPTEVLIENLRAVEEMNFDQKGDDARIKANYFETLLSIGERFSRGEYSFTEENVQAIKAMEGLKHRLDEEYQEEHPVTEISTDPRDLHEYMQELIQREGKTVDSVEGDYYRNRHLPEAA